MEARKINREMHDAVGHTVDSTVTESTIPYMEEPFPTKITPETVKKLVDAPRMLKDWDNELLVLFLNAYDHYGSTKLHTVVHDRWKSSQTLYQVKMSVMTEMKKRGVGYEPTVDPLSRPMRQWTTQELAGFANLMENHRYDAAFKLSYTGFDSVQKCNQLATRVRNELKKRTSDAVAVS
jgi:hypothetical protein